MFKLNSIQFNHRDESQVYRFTSHAFVYGPNTVGKTALTKAIDFVLGSSEELKYQGLDHIDSIEAQVTNGLSTLWIKRTITNGYFYRRTENSEYTEISIETYKDNICLLISQNLNSRYIDIYGKVFDERPTFRSFSFLNYIDEKGLGDLSVVFTRAKDLKHQIRIRNIMDFFFNYENVEQIYEKEIHLENLEKRLKGMEEQYNLYHNSINQILKLFNMLQLNYSGNIEKDYHAFEAFKSSFARKAKATSKDLVYLSRASFSLSEEIKLYSFMQTQSDNMMDRKSRIERLLAILDSVVEKSPEYEEYTKFICETIEEIKEEKLILSLTDYQKAIKEIQKEKEKIDKDIMFIKGQATEISYEDAMKLIGILEHTFASIRQDVDIGIIEKTRESVNQLKREIKALRSAFNKRDIDTFNKALTRTYLDSNLTVKHRLEDSKESNFALEFEPFKLCLFSTRSNNNQQERYTPGSMARQTHLQILVYLSMFEYLRTHFSGFIYLPLLVIDSANQPMGIESFREVYPTIVDFANRIGLQTIFLSKDRLDGIPDEDFIDISSGLNRFHKQEK